MKFLVSKLSMSDLWQWQFIDSLGNEGIAHSTYQSSSDAQQALEDWLDVMGVDKASVTIEVEAG